MEFTHFDSDGNAVMVDVTEKGYTVREAIAEGSIYMNVECFEKVICGGMMKGDVLGTARIAGIMGAKKTPELIPLCHNLSLTRVEIQFETHDGEHRIKVYCKVKTIGKTGVEMEALTGVQIALLTIYDMCKAVDKSMRMENIHLCRKTGGKSGTFVYAKEREHEYER